MGDYLDNYEDDREYYARREQRRYRQEMKRRKKRFRQRCVLLCVLLCAGISIVTVKTMSSAKQKAEQEKKLEVQRADKIEEAGSYEEFPEETPEELLEAIPEVYSFQTAENQMDLSGKEIDSPYFILVDENTDTIIASKGAGERISPASMTKVLTVLVAAEQISKEALEDTFTMTLEITDYAYVNDCSSVGFLDGEEIKVKDLFYGTILPSGGDAAVGLAVYAAGSHEAFVDLMNEKLAELGLSETAHFTNCVGLYDEDHYCTVYDMAIIMKAAIQNELCREILSAHTYTTAPTVQHPEGITISNWFLRRIEDKYTVGEVLCAKTGFVAQSKSCAVSYGYAQDKTPYICVTAGAYSGWRCIYDHTAIYNAVSDTPAEN